jgi:hypothetical protein
MMAQTDQILCFLQPHPQEAVVVVLATLEMV